MSLGAVADPAAARPGERRPSRAAVVGGDVYFTAFSLPHRKHERMVPGSDEDAVTMAVEAAERAVGRWQRDAAEIDAVFVALGHGPDVVGTLAHGVREALGLRPDIRVVPFAADALAGVAALQTAISSVETGELRNALVVASEAAASDPEQNAGAAAVLVAADDGGQAGILVEELARRGELTHEHLLSTPDRPFEPDVRWLQHRYRALLGSALDAVSGDTLAALDGIVFAGGWRAVQQDVAGATPAPADFGVAGPAAALLRAASERPASSVGLVAYGGGQIVVLSVRTPVASDAFGWDEPQPSRGRPDAAPPQGPALPLPVESPFFARTWSESLRFTAAKCDTCGHVAYPPSQRRICAGCGGRAWNDYSPPRTGTVLTFVDNRFLPAGFPATTVFVLGELDDGTRHWAPMPPEVRGAEVAIGDRVALRLRRFTVRDGVPVYGMKYVPATGGR